MSYHPPYAVHPMVTYQQAMVENLPKRTGRSIEEWETIVLQSGPSRTKECRAWLKAEFGLGGTTTMIIANWALGCGRDDMDPSTYLARAPLWVDALYEGPKSKLRDLHDALVRMVLQTADDLKISPAQTMVPVYRRHVIAQIRPSTRTRIDFGLALRDAPEADSEPMLIGTGGHKKGDRLTHRIAIQHNQDINDDVAFWVRRAYELDA